MRILLIGATGTIGKAIAAALGRRHEILPASRQQAPLHVDIGDPASIRRLYAKVGKVGAVISAAGQACFKPLDELSDTDFRFSLDNKLMGQVNLVRYGLGAVVDSGSITITSGILAQQPSRGSGAVSLVNAGLGLYPSGRARGPPGYSDQCGEPPLGYRDPTGTRHAAPRRLASRHSGPSLCRERRRDGDRSSHCPVGSPPNKRLKLTAPRLSEEWRLCADRFRGRLKGRGAGGGRRLQLRRIPLGGAPMSSMWRVRRVL